MNTWLVLYYPTSPGPLIDDNFSRLYEIYTNSVLVQYCLGKAPDTVS